MIKPYSSVNLPLPKEIENGVIVPPRLQIGEMTISEWHNMTTFDAKYFHYTKQDLIDLARKIFSEDEVKKEFRL